MGLVTAKLEDTAAHVVALSILLLNLRKIQYAFLQFLDWLLGFLQPREKLKVVQWTLLRTNDCSALPGIFSLVLWPLLTSHSSLLLRIFLNMSTPNA